MKLTQKKLLSVLLVAVLMGALFLPFTALNRVQAEDSGRYLPADELIASAAKYLGVPYKLGEKGYKNAYGENIRTYPMAMSEIKQNGLDCSGLFYNALTDLGVSTEGYQDNHPVPLATASWFKENGAAYDSLFHINGQAVRPTVVYSGRTNGSRPYYYKYNSGSATIEPGSLVIALPPKKNASGHCWIYLGEFKDRNAVIDYLVSLGFSRSVADKYVGDGKGNGGNHWRIESTAGKNLGTVNKNFKGVMVNNKTNSTSDLGKLGVIQVTTTSDVYNTVTTTASDLFKQTSPMHWVYNKNRSYTGTVYGVIGSTEGWWYVENGVVQLNAYGLQNSAEHGGAVMVNRGRVDLEYNDSFSDDEHQTVYCLKNGRIAWDYTGAAEMSVDVYDAKNNIVPQRAWWRVENGVVNKTYKGVASNEHGWWYFKDGVVQFGYTGIQKNDYGWWRIENGKVNFAATGVYQNELGWWRVLNGKVDFGAQEIYENPHGWWKTTNGKVTFDENGVFRNEHGWWKVKNSKVDFHYTGVAKNQYGWWRIENGKVRFDFTGIASNEYGTWYIENGKVDFSMTGPVEYDGQTYNVTNGKAVLV